MAFLEQDIESNLVDILNNVATIPVYGRAVPEVDPNPDRTSAYIEVKASIRERRGDRNPITDIPIEITCAASESKCKSADYLTQIMEPVINKLDVWASDLDTACDDLSIDSFRVDGFSFDGGEPASYDGDLQTWFCVFNITISGVCVS